MTESVAATTGHPLTPHFPLYGEVRKLLPIWKGLGANAVTRLIGAMWEHTGTPQATEDWSEPDQWIPQRLSGETRDLALAIWQETGHEVNPRYCRGHWYLCRTHHLLADAGDGKLALTPEGDDFLSNTGGEVERGIDRKEGLLFVLEYLGDEGSNTPADLLEPWLRFLAQETRIRSAYAGRIYLSARLQNLLRRGLVRKLGRSYELTKTGLLHLEKVPRQASASSEPAAGAKIRRIIQDEREQMRGELRELLYRMEPYAFEKLIRQLLEALGYTDVEVTKQSNDKGVDVTGKIELGITSVVEVVQAKRTRGNVGRPVLDQLRGSLHRFGAVRGTIVTTADFSKGAKEAAFEAGVAPITLIDGAKLVDLLIENRIGAKRTPFELITIDRSIFEESASQDGEEGDKE